MEIDEQDAEEAICDLFSNRLIQDVSPSALATITRILESPPGVLAPRDLLLPELGEISFSLKGARIIISLYEDVFRGNPSAEYVDDIGTDGTGRIYANSLQQIGQALLDHREDIASFSDVSDPYGIGAWRSRWWYLNPRGWAVDIGIGKGS